ncbi:MAG: tripeptide aminopeptidase [Mariniblastus sp.]|jgi:tripeptide aminopeptidase
MNKPRILERFLQYVKINTTAVEESGKYPSSDGQLEIGKLLVEQMKSMGIADAEQDQWGIVYGTIPGNVAGAPVVAFNSHVDTSPETTGLNVTPNVIENFDGQDIVLSGAPSKVITAAACKELSGAAGKTIITTDGRTLLGGDDKAGVAIIMEVAQHLIENPEIPHGDVRIFFTCDEEIGHGVDHVDLAKVNATVCYNFDSGGQGDIDEETFSADMATVTFTGVNTHPAHGKDKMINASRAAGHFLAKLPAELSPEHTEGRDGFLHPYSLEGGVASATLKILIRDFETAKLAEHANVIRETAAEVETICDGTQVDIEFVEQYRNMADGLVNEPRAVQYAVEAHQALGRDYKRTIVRGGTDGSRLTELGLPTPNLSSGQHNIHSPLEWACLDEMVAAAEVGIEIVKRWAQDQA